MANILSLFDGMSCGMLAMIGAGVQVDNYYAYEIDKYAIKTSVHNFPQIKQCGDVFKGDYTQYEGIDYLIGGSPCTYWSIAQSPDKRETTASGLGWELFSQYVRALHEAKPKYFIYENNKSMSQAICESISKTFGFDPTCINSALVSAQNRQRLYWVGKRNEDGTYSKVDVSQPKDRGILLRDVLDGVAIKEKSPCIDANYYKGGNYTNVKKQSGQRMCVAEPVACRCRGRTDKNGNGYAKYECRDDCKSNTLDTNSTNGNMVAEPVNMTNDGKSQVLKSQYFKNNISNFLNDNTQGCKYAATGIAEPVISSFQVGALPRPNGELSTSQSFRIYNINAKSVTLKAGAGGAGGKTGLYAIPVYKELTDSEMDYMVRDYSDRRWNFCQRPAQDNKAKCLVANIAKGVPYNVCAIPVEFEDGIPTKAVSYADGKTYKVYEVKEGQITIKEKQYPIKLQDGYYIIRKLTVSECKRLQTVPEWFEFPVSDTQAYRQLGAGWTVDVITHLIKATLKDKQESV